MDELHRREGAQWLQLRLGTSIHQSELIFALCRKGMAVWACCCSVIPSHGEQRPWFIMYSRATTASLECTLIWVRIILFFGFHNRKMRPKLYTGLKINLLWCTFPKLHFQELVFSLTLTVPSTALPMQLFWKKCDQTSHLWLRGR